MAGFLSQLDAGKRSDHNGCGQELVAACPADRKPRLFAPSLRVLSQEPLSKQTVTVARLAFLSRSLPLRVNALRRRNIPASW